VFFWQSKPGTAQTQQSAQGPVVPELDIDDNLPNVNAFSRGYTEKELEEIKDIQAKIQGQLKHRRNFKVEEDNHTTLNLEHFKRTLTRYGLDLSEDESDKIFAYYDKDGGGELDHHEFIQGVRGSEFVQTARSYGFETPDPGYHNPDPEGGWGHYVDLAGTERESALTLGTPRCAKAWQQQRAVDGCPFGTDRRMFGGNWQYRTSSLIKAEPIVAPRYGKTGFPARKELSDIMHVIAEKLNERSKGALAFTRMFNQFDTDKNGSIDREGAFLLCLCHHFLSLPILMLLSWSTLIKRGLFQNSTSCSTFSTSSSPMTRPRWCLITSVPQTEGSGTDRSSIPSLRRVLFTRSEVKNASNIRQCSS